MSIIGGSIDRVDGYDKVTGRAIYIDDITLDGMLYGRTIRSSIAHGRIRAIRFDPSFDWTGVVRVTAEDITALGCENVVHLMEDDQPVLAVDVIHHPDEPVALVAADTPERATEAARHVIVDVEALPAQLDYEASTVILNERSIERGDVEAVFARADRVIEGTYHTGLQEQLYIEPQGMLAIPGDDGSMTVKGSLQCPYYVHRAIKRFFGLPDDKVAVVQTVTGGGFGGKEEYPSILGCHAALLARKSGRPVKIVYERSEDLRATTKRHRTVVHHRTAIQDDGTLLAAMVDITMDGGAYVTLSPVVLSRGVIHAVGPYRYDALRIDGRIVGTNTPPAGAFRGFGAPQVTFAYERHMDHIAQTLGMEPLALRMKNRIQVGDESATGQVIDVSFGGDMVLDDALARSDYENKRRAAQAHNARADCGPVRKGVGMSYFFHGAGFTGNGEEKLKGKVGMSLLSGGRVRIDTASTDIGQGTLTIFAQIAADTLNIPVASVVIAPHDTSKVPDSGPTVASRTAMVVGKVVQDASRAILERLGESAGQSFAQRGDEYLASNDSLAVECTYKGPPNVEWDDDTYLGDAYPCYAWAVDVVEVSVDMDTAHVTIDHLTTTQDAGKVLHRVLCEGQIEGGTLQGLGFATSEEVVLRDGRMVNDRLTNYIIPTTLDAPEMDVGLVEAPFPHGPFGAKGIGEMPIDGVAPAVLAAIEHAVGGPLPNVIPLTPERLLAALEDRR
jgi:CO/xanthine dehydrogenase Mo-binding subunit